MYKTQINCQNAVFIAKFSEDDSIYKFATFAIGAGWRYGKAGWAGLAVFSATLFKNVYDARTACGATF